MSGFVLHPDALTDLEEIWESIASDNPSGADRVVGEIYEAIRALVQFPRLGHVPLRPHLAAPPRSSSPGFSDCLCTPDESPLLIIAVLHGRRNPRVLASLLRDRE